MKGSTQLAETKTKEVTLRKQTSQRLGGKKLKLLLSEK